MRVWMFVLLVALPPVSYQHAGASSTFQAYWNIDGNFTETYNSPYTFSSKNSSIFVAPWSTNGWGVFAFSDYPNGTGGSPDAFSFNATQGTAHAWVKEDRRITDPRSGVVGYEQGVSSLGGGYLPSPIGVVGRDTILAYRIRSENTSIPLSLSSPDEDGILFDLILVGRYTVNGTTFTPTLVVDFYVHQECGPLNGGCTQTNDTTVNHRVKGHTHYFEWRIHENLQNGIWASDVVNLRWYLEDSVHRAYCWEALHSDSCSLPAIDANLYGLTTTGEAFGGSTGFGLGYLYLLQANDCGTGVDAGKDFNHPLRIDDLSQISFKEVDGWLGVGGLYKDADDYYEFNVSNNLLGTNNHLLAYFYGADSISLYAPGNPPTLRISSDNQSLSLWYNFSSRDPAGYWYLQVHRSSGFGFYSFDIWLSSNRANGSTPATCSLVAPTPTVEASWQLIAGLAVVTALIVVSGRIWSRRKPAEA